MAEALGAPGRAQLAVAMEERSRPEWQLQLDSLIGSVGRLHDGAPTGLSLAPVSPDPGALLGSGLTPSVTGVSERELAGLGGASLLQQLGLLERAELRGFATAHPDTIRNLLAAPPAARQVSAWWARLDAGTKRDLSAATPELVGNLDGVPYAIRDRANRAFLRQALDNAEKRLADSAGADADALSLMGTLAEIERTLAAGSSPRRSLVSLGVTGEPTAAIAIGDVQSADYVSYLVPGMFFGVRAQIGAWTESAERIYDEQSVLLETLGEAAEADARPTVAAVAWIGYQTPHLFNVGSLDLAQECETKLSSAIAGLTAARGRHAPHVTILAHSYGSTASMMALQDELEVDALAIVGSPGSTVPSVDELNVPADHVFVGEASWDPIPNSSFFGSDPGSEAFGAKAMAVDGGVDALTGARLAASVGHNDYFTLGSESLRNLALIGVDRGDLVTIDGANEVLAER